MADEQFSDLPNTASPLGSAVVPIETAGVTTNATINAIVAASTTGIKANLYLETFADLAALIVAFPAPDVGSWAILTNGDGTDASIAVWDDDESTPAWKVASVTAIAHAASHKSGGADEIKIDEFAAGTTGGTTGDATATTHGLLPHADKVTLDAITNVGDGVIPSDEQLNSSDGDNIWSLNASIVAADPTTAQFRLNHAVGSSATAIYINEDSGNGQDLEALLTDLSTGAKLHIQQRDPLTKWLMYEVTAAVTDNGGWYTIPVAYSAGSSPTLEVDAGVESIIHIYPQGITSTEQALILTNQTNIATVTADVAPTMGSGLTASATVTWAVDAAVRHNVEFLQMDEAHTLAVPTGVVKGHVLDLFVRQGASAVWTLAFHANILIAEHLLDDEGDPPVITPSEGATDMLRFVVDESAVVHLVDHVKEFKRTTDFTPDEVVALPNTIGVMHDFASPTADLQMWCNGKECQPMRYNTTDAKHYSTVWLESDTVANLQILDHNGVYQAFQSKTLPARRQKPTPTTIWYVSPDVAAGAGKYTYDDPGNFFTAEGAAVAKTEIRCFEGSNPYFLGDFSMTADDISIVAVDGEKPVFSGFSPFEPSWTLDASSTYTADALFTGLHNGSSNSATLIDSTATFNVDELIGLRIRNTTDVSISKVTDNTATVVTGVLSGGTDDDWDASDAYSIEAHDPDMQQAFFWDGGNLERLAWFADSTALKASTRGGWTIDTNILYVRMPDDSDPNDWSIKIPRRYDEFLLVQGDRFWMEGITVEGYGATTGSNARGLRLSGSLNSTIRGCTFRSTDAQGLHAEVSGDGCDDLVVEDNVFEDMQNNIIYDDWKDGTFKSEVSTSFYCVGAERVVVRHNTVRGLQDWPLFSAGTNRYFDVHDNIIFNSSDGGELNGVHNQIRFWNNRLDGGKYLLSYASVQTGPIWAINNNSRRMGYLSAAELAAGGVASGGDNECTKFNGSAVNIGQLIIINNTFNQDDISLATHYTSGTEHGCWNNNIGASGAIVFQAYGRNNIFTGHGHPFQDFAATGNYDFDYNLYYTDNTEAYPTLYEWHATTYATFALFQSGSSLEDNGEETDASIDTATGLPAAEIAGVEIPGITGNPIFKSIGKVKGSIIRFP